MTLAVIGAGTIGRAIIESLLEAKYEDKVIATRRQVERIKDLERKNVIVTRDNKYAARKADTIMLCVKPGDVGYVLNEIKDEISGKLVISVAAATPLSFLKKYAPYARFIRAMPNIAVLVQESFTAYCCEEEITEDDKKVAKKIFESMGDCIEIDEKYMDAITGLSGSIPAYLAIIIEAFMYAGLKVGLPRDLALKSSIKAVLGGAKLALSSEKHIAELKDMVVTPGGITIDAIYELEDSGIRTAIMRAVESATLKSKKVTEEILKK